MNNNMERPAVILIVEDSPADQRAVQRAFDRSKFHNKLYFVNDGQEAIEFLKRQGVYSELKSAQRPDLILLDLNLPRLDGRQVLEIVKGDDDLRSIPVVVLTTSSAEEDVVRSYDLGVNSFIPKPVDLESLIQTIAAMEHYWLQIVILPPNGGKDQKKSGEGSAATL